MEITFKTWFETEVKPAKERFKRMSIMVAVCVKLGGRNSSFLTQAAH